MKRIKLVFVAALGILGYVGAHAAAGINTQQPLYRFNGTTYELLDNSKRGQPGGWDCLFNPENTCLYILVDGEYIPYEDGNFVALPAPNIAGK